MFSDMRGLLVEDDTEIAKFIIEGLSSDGFTLFHVPTVERAVQLCKLEKFELAIVDLNLPDGDGLDLIKTFRTEGYSFPILILSARTTVSDKVACLKAGGDDYLIKPFSLSELSARLEALQRRSNGGGNANILTYQFLTLDLAKRVVTFKEQPVDLQPLELNLLQLFLENPEKLLSKSNIIKEVWKFNFNPSTNIVEARISKLRDKLAEAGSEEMLHTVRGAGYILMKK
jgi:two-component system OmpR family response regulator